MEITGDPLLPFAFFFFFFFLLAYGRDSMDGFESFRTGLSVRVSRASRASVLRSVLLLFSSELMEPPWPRDSSMPCCCA